MHQVDPVTYSGVGRAERRRIAKELATLRELRSDATNVAARLRARKAPVVPAPFWAPKAPIAAVQSQSDQLEALARQITSSVHVPLRLLACAACHRPTPQCTCLDNAGTPLDWGLGSAL